MIIHLVIVAQNVSLPNILAGIHSGDTIQYIQYSGDSRLFFQIVTRCQIAHTAVSEIEGLKLISSL